jgi:hypothetical protein
MRARTLAAVLLGTLLGVAVGCTVGSEQEPGCQTDADCGAGWTCAAGACFRATTGLSLADGGDAAPDGG